MVLGMARSNRFTPYDCLAYKRCQHRDALDSLPIFVYRIYFANSPALGDVLPQDRISRAAALAYVSILPWLLAGFPRVPLFVSNQRHEVVSPTDCFRSRPTPQIF